MSDEPFHPLTTEAEWSEALALSEDEPVLVFKHSTACPVSAKADQEMSELTKELPVPVFKVVVQDHRTISDQISESLDVRHETPQAILLEDRSSVFNTSHFNVTVDTLREEVRRIAITNE